VARSRAGKKKKRKKKKKGTRRNLARWVAAQSGLSQRQSYAVIGDVLSGIEAALVAGGTVELRGFGTFWVHEREAVTIQVPGKGPVEVDKRRHVMFRPGTVLEQRIRTDYVIK